MEDSSALQLAHHQRAEEKYATLLLAQQSTLQENQVCDLILLCTPPHSLLSVDGSCSNREGSVGTGLYLVSTF